MLMGPAEPFGSVHATAPSTSPVRASSRNQRIVTSGGGYPHDASTLRDCTELMCGGLTDRASAAATSQTFAIQRSVDLKCPPAACASYTAGQPAKKADC